jgi:scyllo-inositol 2-dehydrogenase (NADP+)
MRVVVVGIGVQGRKRRTIAGDEVVATVDPIADDVDYNNLEDVPLDAYDAALVCTPDDAKETLLRFLLGHGKHVLVEKPLVATTTEALRELAALARDNKAVCYTAYNHRFEPHFVRMKECIDSGVLGRIYSCRMFYGNGTARLVRDSRWRDQGAGVLGDLGSHLLDTANYWFGTRPTSFDVVSSNSFENRAPDHVVLVNDTVLPRLEFEMTLLMWRNHFTCDVLGEKGSAHIESLCKWGPTTFRHRTRVLPSGRPEEDSETLEQDDPTWALEYDHFKLLCADPGDGNLDTDIWISDELERLSEPAIRIASRAK